MNAIRLILAFMLLSVCAMAATGQERRPRTLDDPGNGRRDVFRGKYHFTTEEGILALCWYSTRSQCSLR